MPGRRTEVSTPSTVWWVFKEDEFKTLLGITDPQGVLLVRVNFSGKTIEIALSKNGGEA